MIVVVFGGLGVSQVSAQAVPTAPPHDHRTELTRSPLAATTARSQQAVGASLFPWSRVVYQTYGNNNWEIYIANDDGSQPLRLTNSGDSDIHPRLNRGTTRVVHAAKAGDYEIRAMNADGSGGGMLTNNDQDDVSPAWSPDGSRIAFQSYRDGQAEIYVMNADGANQTRLTVSADYDGDPAWSPDGGKIVFVSRRTGNYRLWVMNADGSGPVILSNQNYSFNPAWSPDGSRIAYDADGNGDGWQELWVMNADGSNQHVVLSPTYNTDAWAGSWSPDSRYLAYTLISFIYYQGNWYWTTAYLEAFDTVTTIAGRLSSDDTAWNPDWQSPDTSAPASTIAPLAATSPSPIRVSWSGSDAGVSGVKDYDVQVKDGAGGAWVNWLPQTTQTSGDYPGIGGHTYYFRVRARDNSSNLEAWPATHDAATTVEALPPVSAIQSLPAFARDTLAVQWGGSDPGFSGIQTYDVQYRVGAGGNWQDWQLGTGNTQATFIGTPGQTYYFRARATDRAQNVEDWPPGNGDGQVTFYDWQLTGTVRDNTGAPVGGAQVTVSPNGLVSPPSTIDGEYAAYALQTSPTYSATWSKSGYGVLPPTLVEASQDERLRIVLPPIDNVVQNWGFESGSLVGWQVSGVLTTIASLSARHTGLYGLSLGEAPATFAPPLDVSPSSQQVNSPVMASDSNRTLHLFWAEASGVWHRNKLIGGTWSPPQLIAFMTHPPQQVEADPFGGLHVIWSTYDQVLYARRASDGSWTMPESVSGLINSFSETQFRVDPTGEVHAAWIDTRYSYQLAGVYYARRSISGQWSQPFRVGTGYILRELQLALDNLNRPHLTWSANEYSGGQMLVHYVAAQSTGAWPPAILFVAGAAVVDQRPQVLIDAQGVVHLVWNGSDGVYYARGGSGGFSAPERVPGLRECSCVSAAIDSADTLFLAGKATGWRLAVVTRSPGTVWSEPKVFDPPGPLTGAMTQQQLRLSPAGGVAIAWTESISNVVDVYYVQRDQDSHWTTPKNLSQTSAWSHLPQIELDRGGNLHFLWHETLAPDSSHIFYVGPATESVTGVASLAQPITIPAEMVAPMLSIQYQLGNPGLGQNGRLAIHVQSNSNTVTVWSSDTSSDGWAQGSVALGDYAGQTITLTLEVNRVAGFPATWALLDEITIGSSYPDVWAASNAPITRRGELVTYTITYGNQGGAAADNAQVTFTLPAGVTFVSASEPPTSQSPQLTWNVGALLPKTGPNTITVTARVAVDVPIPSTLNHTVGAQTTSAELETLNNTQTVTTTVQPFMIYLPLVRR
jgi:uncharacterized repeat protein (TIGR01451 family)